MAMTKRVTINSDKTGRIETSKIDTSKTHTNRVTEARRGVVALYPIEPTSISKTQLDKAILNAMAERLLTKR